VRVAPVGLLQFHGDETAEQCAVAAAAANRPFIRAFRVKPSTAGSELLEYDAQCRASSRLHAAHFAGLLFDTHVDAYGGAGKVFDWSVIPKELAHRAVLSGGLSVQNATGAVAQVRPWAVDVSSGVEAAKGLKDAGLIAQFIAAVEAGDAIPGNDAQVRTA
jgi:phosphoribosylanthranilate isomerase